MSSKPRSKKQPTSSTPTRNALAQVVKSKLFGQRRLEDKREAEAKKLAEKEMKDVL